ncbi:MAG: hypothetical protein U0514_02980 [Candidatus Andersenbacteria bacterium]
MKTVLISVFNKSGIVEVARELVAMDWRIVSSGGTARVLREAGLAVTDVAEISGLPPILKHRVVTLVPHIHGGLLATEDMRPELEQLGYPWIDMLIADFYPLEAAIAKPGATRESVIEDTDIGGPTMVRSAAKGRRIVVVDPADRARVTTWLKEGQPKREEFVTHLCAKAEGIVANYCLTSARYHSDSSIDGFVGTQARLSLKYGENACQKDVRLFSTGSDDPLSLANLELIEGDNPSYVNVTDVDRMLQTMTHIVAARQVNGFAPPEIPHSVAIGVKHGNPCGVGIAVNGDVALEKMLQGDLLAIHGGFVMVNFTVGQREAECSGSGGRTTARSGCSTAWWLRRSPSRPAMSWHARVASVGCSSCQRWAP